LKGGLFDSSSESVSIKGTVCTFCTVEIFENDSADGEGETFVGSATAGDAGNFRHDRLSEQTFLTATAPNS
jgi:hypothetical protein